MQTQGAPGLWGSSSGMGEIESNWGIGAPSFSSGANNMNLLGYGGNSSLSNNQGHMQSGASSTLVDSINASRGGWGAPGTLPPSQSTNKLPTSTGGNMQGSLPVSGAQHNGPQSSQPSGSLTTSQSPGPNGGMSSQGNSAFGNNAGFQKISTGNASSGLAINPATSINSSNGSSAQSNDNMGTSGWGMPISTQDSRLTGTNTWGNSSGADWDQTSTSVSQTQGSAPQPGIQSDQQRPSSWAQAAGKGLNLQASNQNATNSMSQEDVQRQKVLRMAIESHDGWGKKHIRQDTQWNIETSPKVQRKISTASVVPEQQQQKGTNNMWNNNNGTAIWEANKDNMSAWSGNQNPAARAPGQPPSNWPGGQQKPPDPPVTNPQWGVGAPGQAPGPDKNMGPWGAPPGNQANNANWGGSTETGYFGGPSAGASGGGAMATWGEAEGSAGWGGDARNSGNNDGTSYWGDPQTKPPSQQPNWNAPGTAPPSVQPAIGQNRKIGSGWGDPMGGQGDPKIDDGTGLWQSGPPVGHQQPPRAPGGWTGGDPTNQAQWNPAIGKPTTKLANQNPAQFGGVDDLNWNLPKENAMKFPTGPVGVGAQPPQKIRVLQQLMDMGFKKDDAHHALISNNMNIQNAITDLYNRRGAMGGKKEDFDMARMSGLLQDDDISDTQPDSNSFVPNMNHMQNTPFNNAQPKIPNQFPFNNGPSLNNPSSLNSNNPSINNALQQKIIQKFQSQQPPPPTPQSMNQAAQGPMGRNQLPGGQQNPAAHQHMAQQQILQQLRMAVQAGLISPQLLNQQLPANVLVMLQQLLQQQQNLQQLINTQQMLQQPNIKLNPQMQRMQLENVAGRINSIKQLILQLQKSISQAQSSLLSKTQSQPQQPPPVTETVDTSLPSDLNMNNLSIATSQPQSRLNQWKRSTPDKESPDSTATSTDQTVSTIATTTASSADDTSDAGSLNKTVGSKPIGQSNSTPNLRHFDELGLTQLGGDTTWSSSSCVGSQNWPSTEGTGGSDAPGGNESLMSTAGSAGSNSSSVLDSLPAIPEFVPGKPWQGISKNVEDDPHITPGSIVRSLSVNTVKDDYLLSLTKSSPNSESNSSWPSKPPSSSSQAGDKPWSSGGESSLAPTTFTSEVWGVPMGKGAMSRPPPGLPQQQQKSGWTGGNQWGGSTTLILKNLSPQIDKSTLKTVCMQHGPLQYFHMNPNGGQALVKYRAPEEAMKAQKSLNTCVLGNTTIIAEFVSEAEVQHIEKMSAMSAGPSQWSQGGQQQPPPGAPHQSAILGGGNPPRQQDPNIGSWGASTSVASSLSGGNAPGSAGGMWGKFGGNNRGAGSVNTGSNLWGTMDENLLGNMLGETM